MTPYFFDRPGNPHASEHSFGWDAHAATEEAASRIAVAIGADRDEIFFTSGATEANNLAILGMVGRAPSGRRRILVSSIEHKSVLLAADAGCRRGDFEVEVLPVDDVGVLRMDLLKRSLRKDVLLVAVMAVNNEIGTIEPIVEVATLCREVGAHLLVDAAQALAAVTLNVHDDDVGLLSLSAHKIYGPKGIGALYVRRDLRAHLEPQLYGGGQQGGLRAGTLPVPLCVAFGEAVALMTGSEALTERENIRALRDRLLENLQHADVGVRVNGPIGAGRHPGNMNVRFPGTDAHNLLMAMQPHLAAATGSACTTGVAEPSHVLRAIGLPVGDALGSIRLGVGRFTTDSDIDTACLIIKEAVRS
jgi:cysteine desulfurase